MNKMSEDEIIDTLKEINVVDFYNTYTDSTTDFSEPRKYCDAIQDLLDLYKQEKEKNKRYEKYLKSKDKQHEQVLEYLETEKENEYISKDKIRAKIKELEEIVNRKFVVDNIKEKAEAKIDVLKELLEWRGLNMNHEETEKVLDELNNVIPEKLNKDAKRLYDAIMTIVDEMNFYKQKYEDYCKQIKEILGDENNN